MGIMKERRVVGIDLGTSNSAVAYWDGVDPKIIPNEFGDIITPSVVWFDRGRRELIVGKQARERIGHDKYVVTSIKRKMGTGDQIDLGGTSYLPHEIAAIILRALKQQAEQSLGEPITRAVITVPAYFSASAVEATREAGQLAELDVVDLLAEPTAAALAYYYRYDERGEKNWLIYDSGAGTTDISVVALRNGRFEVLGTAGDNFMAGDDYDRRLRDFILAKAGVALDDRRPDQRNALLTLKVEAEEAKIGLSSSMVAEVTIPYLCNDIHGNPITVNVEISRAEFEDLIRPQVASTCESCLEALKKAQLALDELDEVILVGGSSHIPLVAEMVEERLAKQPRKNIDPFMCVVEGAAILSDQHRKIFDGQSVELEIPELKTLTRQSVEDLVGQVRLKPEATATLSGGQVSIGAKNGGFTDQFPLGAKAAFEFELPLSVNMTNYFTLAVEDDRGQELDRADILIRHSDQATELLGNIEHRAPYPISIGLKDNKISQLIPENTPLPQKVTKTVYTIEDNQTSVYIPVYEGNHPAADRNRYIGKVLITDIPTGYPENTEVYITLTVDRRRVNQVTATHRAGQSASAVILPGWTHERSMDDLQREVNDLLAQLRATADGVGNQEFVDRLNAIDQDIRAAFQAHEKAKVLSRLDMLKQLQDELAMFSLDDRRS